MQQKPLLVLKFGTASITQQNGEPDEQIIAEISRQVAILHQNHRIVLVSSGAVGAGKNFINDYRGEIAQRKAAAAIGNPLLINIYAQYFAQHGICIAQSLCERHHFGNREQFLQLKQTYEALWESNIIPIANENDVVSSRELKFSDNDELATLIAVGFGAENLMLCTSVGGFLDNSGKIIPKIEKIDEKIQNLVDNSKSALGSGGMSSKLAFTKLAMRLGIGVVIFGMKETNGILRAWKGEIGTRFEPSESSISARNKWLVSGGIAVGRVRIDAGAVKALKNRNSLLAVGVKKIDGGFEQGDLIEITDYQGELLATARCKVSSESLIQNLKTQNFEVANAHDIVLL